MRFVGDVVVPAWSAPRVTWGAAAGIAGGLVFGAMMTMGGMMPMVAMLVGSTSVAVGWAVHLLLSTLFGSIFGSFVAPAKATRTLALGVAWGVVLWAVAAMVVMRSALGAPIALDPMAVQSLAGHVAYGAVLGAAYASLAARAPRAGPGRASPR